MNRRPSGAGIATAGCLVMLFNLAWIAIVVAVIIFVARWALGLA